jgi:hypothetical protein
MQALVIPNEREGSFFLKAWSNLGDGSVWERSLTEFTLSLSEEFEMTNADLVVVPAGKEYFSS